jgi:hypothetical protein
MNAINRPVVLLAPIQLDDRLRIGQRTENQVYRVVWNRKVGAVEVLTGMTQSILFSYSGLA